MYKKLIIAMTFLFIALQSSAQQFQTPSYAFSHKKTAYITLNDGTELKGILKDLDRKKGIIKALKFEDGEGKKHKLLASDVKYMYLPPSGLDKLQKTMDFLGDSRKWNDEKLDQDLLNKGLVYFEQANVKIKKKEMLLLVQLLNPMFSKVVKVYHDPIAGETTSVGVGPMKAGGIAKSYYINVNNDKAAYKVAKKDYKKEFVPMWKSCSKVAEQYGEDVNWRDLAKHVLLYSECSDEKKELK
ncbi:hypothetical protein [Flammeovirga sp. SJP92]|uniref:hypothetical protein n=1 Tax=Flammeovirga sp. SJP92 TaxID=1775430 RepID=UPI000786E4D6|nr:hypothetical protein [Flammeovirga sp. SJP92]KXX67487.1 hypothetical protein AVL50_25810 [Flammeovirga sp. SJP92]